MYWTLIDAVLFILGRSLYPHDSTLIASLLEKQSKLRIQSILDSGDQYLDRFHFRAQEITNRAGSRFNVHASSFSKLHTSMTSFIRFLDNKQWSSLKKELENARRNALHHELRALAMEVYNKACDPAYISQRQSDSEETEETWRLVHSLSDSDVTSHTKTSKESVSGNSLHQRIQPLKSTDLTWWTLSDAILFLVANSESRGRTNHVGLYLGEKQDPTLKQCYSTNGESLRCWVFPKTEIFIANDKYISTAITFPDLQVQIRDFLRNLPEFTISRYLRRIGGAESTYSRGNLLALTNEIYVDAFDLRTGSHKTQTLISRVEKRPKDIPAQSGIDLFSRISSITQNSSDESISNKVVPVTSTPIRLCLVNSKIFSQQKHCDASQNQQADLGSPLFLPDWLEDDTCAGLSNRKGAPGSPTTTVEVERNDESTLPPILNLGSDCAHVPFVSLTSIEEQSESSDIQLYSAQSSSSTPQLSSNTWSVALNENLLPISTESVDVEAAGTDSPATQSTHEVTAVNLKRNHESLDRDIGPKSPCTVWQISSSTKDDGKRQKTKSERSQAGDLIPAVPSSPGQSDSIPSPILKSDLAQQNKSAGITPRATLEQSRNVTQLSASGYIPSTWRATVGQDSVAKASRNSTSASATIKTGLTDNISTTARNIGILASDGVSLMAGQISTTRSGIEEESNDQTPTIGPDIRPNIQKSSAVTIWCRLTSLRRIPYRTFERIDDAIVRLTGSATLLEKFSFLLESISAESSPRDALIFEVLKFLVQDEVLKPEIDQDCTPQEKIWEVLANGVIASTEPTNLGKLIDNFALLENRLRI